MADAPRSPLAPIEQMSFQTCVMIGAVAGLLLVGVAWALGPVQVDEAAQAGKPKPRRKVIRDTKAKRKEDRKIARGGRVGGGGDSDEARYRRDGEDDDERDEPEPGDERSEGEDDAEGLDEGLDEGDDEGEGEGDDEGEDEGEGDDELEVLDEGDDGGEDEREGDDPSGGEDEGDDGENNGGASSKTATIGTPASSRSTAAESKMSAAEMREEAKKALSEKRYRDAYRLSTRSYYKEKSNETLEIKGKAACGMNDERAAKGAVKALPVGDDRRKNIRTFCRDRGVRLGI